MPLVHFHGVSADLFDPPEAPLPQWSAAFEAWLDDARARGHLAQRSSQQAYRELWTVLLKWALAEQPPVTPQTLVAADLEAFLRSRSGQAAADAELTPRYVWRLLHLVDRVLAHWARRHGGPPNPAARQVLESRPEWRYANAALHDGLPEHLSAVQARQLVDHLSRARPRPGRPGRVLPANDWQSLRNHCAVALQLGAGLTPGEVRALKLDQVVVEGGRRAGLPWKLAVPADGSTPARETPLAGWAAQVLQHWLQVRSEAGIAGEQLFPSTRSGKPWGKVAQYGAARAVLEAAGLPPEVVSGGSFRLRHTFALRQLRRGHPPEQVMRWLGLVDPSVMARYQRVVIAPVDDLA